MEKIILASGSPRRRELLSQIGIEYEVIPSTVEENTTETKPDKVVMELARLKAVDVSMKYPDNRIVLGSDTIVAVDDEILGKPETEEAAFLMIKKISGRTHFVYTGVTLVRNNNGTLTVNSFCEKTLVHVKPMTDEEIRAYIDNGESMDKAGAYGIQGSFAAFITGISGDYNNIVGLPVSRVYDELKAF